MFRRLHSHMLLLRVDLEVEVSDVGGGQGETVIWCVVGRVTSLGEPPGVCNPTTRTSSKRPFIGTFTGASPSPFSRIGS